MITAGLPEASDGVIFDDTGNPWRPAERAGLADFGPVTDHSAIIAYAVRILGFVHVMPIRDALLVTFDPSVVRPLAGVAASHAISAHGAKRLILVYPSRGGHPDRSEIFNSVIEGLTRFSDAANLTGKAVGLPSSQTSLSQGLRQPRLNSSAKSRSAILRAGTLHVKSRAGDRSLRLSRPLASISDDDAWLRQLLLFWGHAREGRRLPSTESLDTLELLNIARGRAHIVETTNSNAAGYRFRLWGATNSYGNGYANRTLGEMPAGLMRDEAIAHYRRIAATGMPSYDIINLIEKNLSFSYARLLLPLAQDGRRVDRLIVLINERRLPELGTL